MRICIPSFILSFLSLTLLIMGLSLFMMKSPEAQIENYQTLAVDYIQKSQDPYLTQSASLYLLDQADILVTKASLLNPYDLKLTFQRERIATYKADVARTTNTAFLPRKEIIQ